MHPQANPLSLPAEMLKAAQAVEACANQLAIDAAARANLENILAYWAPIVAMAAIVPLVSLSLRTIFGGRQS